MSRIRAFWFLALTLLVASSLQAVTYVVPSDRDLVRRADAIVIATAVESHAEETAVGGIATLTSFLIDSQLKGDALETLQVFEPGGSIDGRTMFIPGAPRFNAGAQYLLFLHRMPTGRLTTYALGLGRFEFTRDFSGRQLVARGATEAALGWNEDGSVYVEHVRSAAAFLDFVRAVAQSPNAPASENYFVPMSDSIEAQVMLPKPVPTAARGDYLWDQHLRWNNNATASIGYCCGPTFQPAPYDGPSAATTAVSNWNGTGAIHYNITGAVGGGTTCVGVNAAPCGGLRGSDGVNTILFNDPNNELASFGSGIVALGGVTNASGGYTVGSESFTATQEIDAVIGKNSQFPAGIPQGTFNAVVTHELGHTLGFRHADGTGNSSSPPPSCAAPLPCSSGFQAIMEHIVNRTSLGQWDLDAASTVYGSGPAPCNAVTSVSVSATSTSITAGQAVTLTASVTGGSSPFNYQWYQGAAGNTSNPIGTGQSINVSPGSTTSYWVRVSPTCGSTPASTDSGAVTITVTCQNPQIISQPQSTSVLQGSGTTLSVAASGSNATYQWFQGTPPSGSALPGQTGSTLFTGNLNTTTSFYVAVTACGVTVNSNAATVTVAPCTQASIITQPQSTSVLPGGSATLSVQAGGTNLSYQWFLGPSGNTSNPVSNGTGPAITVTPSGTTQYWVRVTAGCGSQTPANSNTVTVTVGVACNTTLSGITVSPQNPLPAQSFTLTANATTTTGSLSYQWYRGGQGDTSNPIGNAATITVSQTVPSQAYWVVVASTCGGVQPAAQTTVTLNTGACGTNPNQMCISSARYRVTLTATDPRTGKTGNGVANYQSDVFGYFTLPDFSNPGDPQVFVKVLGPVAPPIGQNAPWVFYSGLTDLRYTLTVVDTATGQTFNTYNVNPPAQDPRGLSAQQSIGDYDVNGNNAHNGDKNVQCAPVQITTTQTGATPGNCPANASTLCLLNRFTVSMRAKVNNASGATDNGVTIAANSQFGFFTTPNIAGPTDVQGFIKMLDANSLGLGYWVFLGGLTDFELTYTVTDTQSGKQKIYKKPAGSTCGWSDVPNAF